MKRSYHSSIPPSNSAVLPQTNPYAAATYQAQPQLNHAPPLPAGQPPPPPNAQAANPYSHYAPYPASTTPAAAVQQQQVAQHPQYPGYGYGGQVAQPQAAPAAAPAVSQDAAAAAYAAQYAAYYAAYAQAAQVQAQSAQPSSASPYPAVAAQPQMAAAPYPVNVAPPPQYHQNPAPPHQQQPFNTSQGAPPYKRTRYDQPPLPQTAQPPLPPGPPPPMPPSVLPPVGGGGNRGPPRSTTDRGGYPNNSRGPPPNNSRDYDYPNDHRYGSGGGGRGSSPGPPRGSVGGRGPRMGGNGPPGSSMGPPLPAGPRGPRAGPSSYPSRDDRGGGGGRGSSSRTTAPSSSSRPLSGLPGSHKYNGPTRSSGSGPAPSVPNAPKGPKSLGNSVTSAATSSPRRGDRKWGSSAPGDARRPSDRDRERERERERDGEGGKRTLTDFRIEGLEIEELEWKWNKAEEKEEDVTGDTKSEVKEEDLEPKEIVTSIAQGTEAENDERVDSVPEQSSADVLSEKNENEDEVRQEEQDSKQHEEQEPEEDSTADMSIDGIQLPAKKEDVTEVAQHSLTSDGPPSDPLPTPSTAISTSTIAKGKHARPEDDSATEDSTNEEEKVRKERETKAKKVKVEKQVDDEEEVPLVGNGPSNEHEEESTVTRTEPASTSEPSKPSLPPLTHPLPSKPVSIPTGPKSAHAPAPSRSSTAKDQSPAPVSVPPPSSRENSRLRIYFSSPIPISSSSATPSLATGPQDRSRTPKIEEGGRGEPAPTPLEVDKKSNLQQAAEPSKVIEKLEETKDEVKADANVDGEDVDGEDVDGEALDGEMVEEAGEAKADEKQGEREVEARAVQAEGPKHQSEGDVVSEKEAEAAEPKGEEVPEAAEESSPPPPALAPPLVVPPPEPTADRISISYARNTRRMVVDAEVVESVKIFRSSGKIEVVVNCEAPIVGVGEHQLEDEYRICKGILVEALDTEADDYIVMDRASLEDAWRQHERPDGESVAPSIVDEPLLPPLHHFLTHSSPNEEPTLSIVPSTSFSRPSFTIVAQLDRANPLTEARWVKTGEVENWILSLGIANGQDPKDREQLSKWLGKITVVDPDQAPSIQHAFDSWATSSNIGSLEDRKEFVKTHMPNIDNVVEILLRLSRGDRSGPSHYSSPSHAQPSTVGALAHQLSAPFPSQQTQVSLAILAMFRLTVETAEKAGIDKSEIEKQVSEIIRSVPYHLQFKALDGMFREVFKPRGSGGKGGSGRMNKGGGSGRRD